MKYNVQNIMLFLNKYLTEKSLQRIKHSVKCSFRKLISVSMGPSESLSEVFYSSDTSAVSQCLFIKGEG